MRSSKPKASPVKVWELTGNGVGKASWDGLRRDHDLCFDAANCFVYFYNEGQSRRGPSLQIPAQALVDSQCDRILALAEDQRLEAELQRCLGQGKVELFLGPPSNMLPAETRRWNITTRNFFAWMFGKPLVGEHLGPALNDLYTRMKLYRSEDADNLQDLLAYAGSQGYLEFTARPQYALSLLYFAEQQKLATLWIDSFAHCVGMDPYLGSCSESKPLSWTTKTSITRTYLAVQVKIEQDMASLRDFLDRDLTKILTGIPDTAARHLDEFRAFLHMYCQSHYKNWPPLKHESYPKLLLKSMRSDFGALFEYLSDNTTAFKKRSLDSPGGLDTRQKTELLDKAQSWSSLRYTSPLIPHITEVQSDANSRQLLRNLRSGKQEKRERALIQARMALKAATNRSDDEIMSTPLVQAYEGFEYDDDVVSETTVSLTEGRKLRWILIYAVLQRLRYLLTAPAEVSDSDSAFYPLCCGKFTSIPWQEAVLLTHEQTADDGLSIANKEPQISELEIQSPRHSVFTEPEISENPGSPLTDSTPDHSQNGDDPTTKPIRRRSTLNLLTRTSWLSRGFSKSKKPERALTVPLHIKKPASIAVQSVIMDSSDSVGQASAKLDVSSDDTSRTLGAKKLSLTPVTVASPAPLSMTTRARVSVDDGFHDLEMSRTSSEDHHTPLSPGHDSSLPGLTWSNSTSSNRTPASESSPDDRSHEITNDESSIQSPQPQFPPYQHELLEKLAKSMLHVDTCTVSPTIMGLDDGDSLSQCVLNIPQCECST